MAVFTWFSGGFCILRVCVAPAAPPPLWAVPGPPGHEKRTPTDADAHDLKIVVKLRAVPASKVPFPVEIAGFPDFSRPVPVYPAFLKYVVPVHSRAASDRIWRTGTSGVAPLHSRGQPPGCGSCPLAAAMQNPLSAAVTMFAVPTFPAAKSRNKPPVYFFAKSIIPQFLQKINDCKKNIMVSQQNRKRRRCKS